MAEFNRFDIIEAYSLVEVEYNSGGVLWERDSNKRRNESTACQLARIESPARSHVTFEHLTDNGREIYFELLDRYGFDYSSGLHRPGRQ